MIRGTLRLGAIGLAIGLVFMAMAPTNAKALTPISISEFEPFPDSVVDDAALPGRGVVLAGNGNNSEISAMPFDNGLEEVSSNLGSPSFGLIVASQKLGFQVLPFANGNESGPVENPAGSDGEVGLPVEPPGGNPQDGHDTVTTAPEPATWLMMIAGFGIVAWRLRHREQRSHGAMPAHA